MHASGFDWSMALHLAIDQHWWLEAILVLLLAIEVHIRSVTHHTGGRLLVKLLNHRARASSSEIALLLQKLCIQ